jgi:hypothetical protein
VHSVHLCIDHGQEVVNIQFNLQVPKTAGLLYWPVRYPVCLEELSSEDLITGLFN